MATPLLPGFMGLVDVLNNRVTDQLIPVLDNAMAQAVAVHNANTAAMLSTFVAQTTQYKFKYRSPSAALYLQSKDQFGRTRGGKGTATYELGLPIHEAGVSFGYDLRTRLKASVGDVNARLVQILEADKRWLRNNILAGLFANTNFTFQDEDHGVLTVLPLANGDAQVYNVLPGSEDGTTAQNFAAQAAGIADGTNPFPTMYSTLHNRPENGDGKVIALIPTNLVASVQALTTFIAKGDSDIQEGSNTRILTGSIESPLPGNVFGKAGLVWVAEWKSLPDNYIIGLHTGADKPLAMREDEIAELRGFRAEGERADFPYVERYYARRAGFGCLNRLGAYVLRIGNATYAVPTNFARTDVL